MSHRSQIGVEFFFYTSSSFCSLFIFFVSLSAWNKTFQGQETNFCEHGEAIRPALLNERSGRHFATWGEFCYQKYHVIIVTVFILPLIMSNGPLTSYIIICLFVIRVILLQPRYPARVLLFLQRWKLF